MALGQLVPNVGIMAAGFVRYLILEDWPNTGVMPGQRVRIPGYYRLHPGAMEEYCHGDGGGWRRLGGGVGQSTKIFQPLSPRLRIRSVNDSGE